MPNGLRTVSTNVCYKAFLDVSGLGNEFEDFTSTKG